MALAVHLAFRTALVTGASSGIGEQVARQLAANGCDLVAVARREAALRKLAGELGRAHDVQVEVLAADLSTDQGLAVVRQRLADPDRPVELLVNNAGYGAPGDVAALGAGDADGQVKLNVLALVALTHAALPGMLRRGHGGILNVSSVAGFVPSPGSAIYAATKSFVTVFSEGLHGEVSRHGVHVTALCPGFTTTEFHDDLPQRPAVPPFAWLDAGRVARVGLDAVAAGRTVAVPGAAYKAVVPLTRVIPRPALRSIMKARLVAGTRPPLKWDDAPG